MPRRPRRQPSLALRLRIHAFLLLLPLLAVAVAAGVGQLVTGGILNQVAQTSEQAQRLGQLHDDLQGVADAGLRYLVDRTPTSRAAYTAAEQRVADDLAGWRTVPERTPEQNRIFAALQFNWTISTPDRAAVGTAGALPGTNSLADSAAFWISSDFETTTADVTRIQQINTAQLAALQTDRTNAEHIALLITVAALLLGVVAALVLSHRLTRSILTPLHALERGSEAVSAGDYDRSVPDEGYAEFSRVGGAFNDMVAQVKTRGEEIQSRERRLAALLANASDGILVIGRDSTLVFATPAFADAFHSGNGNTALIGDLVHADDRERAGRAWARVLAGGLDSGEEVEARMRHRDGTWHHVWCRFTNRFDDPDVEGMVLNLSDVTERHEYEERLSYQALHDPLTGAGESRALPAAAATRRGRIHGEQRAHQRPVPGRRRVQADQ
ncbi:MAG: HAMP domain-containing protein [Candidatus Dormibacteraeota bacterium]|nr:HAMP domain-containing protein [Candidatus Dormibacteraeota bacterium]